MMSVQSWTRRVVAVTFGIASTQGIAQHATAAMPAPGYSDTRYVGGLEAPTAIAFLPDGRLVITEKGGTVRIAENPPIADAAASAGSIDVCAASEMGLLGVAVDPMFAGTGRLFFYRTEDAGGCGSAAGRFNEIVSTTLVSGQIGTLTPLLSGMRTDGGNHDGSTLRIGPDGTLYASVGDTGIGDGGPPGSSTNPYAANLNALEGKILRLNLDGSIPSDNPYVGQAGTRAEIFAAGFRNPFRMAFDPLSGGLWVGDVGQSTIEEIDVVAAGGYYGWPLCEGTAPMAMGCPDIGELGAPVFEYDHAGRAASITGGAFATSGAQVGRYFFGDYVRGTIWALDLDVTRTMVMGTAAEIVTGADGPVDFAFGPDGALYYVALNSGEVRRVSHAGFSSTTTSTTTITTTSTESSSTTSTETSTTTTMRPGDCLAQPTFVCVGVALDAVVERTSALPDVGAINFKLRVGAKRARDAFTSASTAAAGLAPRLLKRAITALAAVRRRLDSGLARVRLDPVERARLVEATADALVRVRALRATL